MEFLRGSSLAQRMTSPLPLTLDDKLNIVAQLCAALHYAHDQGVVHRDIKPANIFILPDGTVKLLDFGVAKLTTSTLTRQGDVLGSASYMSPEQVSGSETVDGRSDIFSVGVMLYELLAGRKPFIGEGPTATIVKILREDAPPLNQAAPGLPPQLVAAVREGAGQGARRTLPDRRRPLARAAVDPALDRRRDARSARPRRNTVRKPDADVRAAEAAGSSAGTDRGACATAAGGKEQMGHSRCDGCGPDRARRRLRREDDEGQFAGAS